MATALFIIYGIALIALGFVLARTRNELKEKSLTPHDLVTKGRFYALLDTELDAQEKIIKEFVEANYAHKRKSRKLAGPELSSFNGDELTPEPEATNGAVKVLEQNG